MLYLIFLLLFPVSRTSPTSRTSLDRPVFSSASCSSTVRNLHTDTERNKKNPELIKAKRCGSAGGDVTISILCKLPHLRICSAAVRRLWPRNQQRGPIKPLPALLPAPSVAQVLPPDANLHHRGHIGNFRSPLAAAHAPRAASSDRSSRCPIGGFQQGDRVDTRKHELCTKSKINFKYSPLLSMFNRYISFV